MTERLDRIHARASALAGNRAQVRAETTTGGESAPSTAELWLYGVVGGYWWGFNDKTVADALRGLEVDQIIVRLNSPGGNAIDGIAIGNILRNHKAKVQVVVDGVAASSASVIALAGDELVMSPGSQLMLHDPWMLTVGNAADLRSDAAFLDKQAVNYAELYAYSASKGTADSWREVMLADNGRGTWYTAQEAVDAGLADRVGTVTTTTPPPVEPIEEDLNEDEMAARAAWDIDVLVHPAVRATWRERSTKPPSADPRSGHHKSEGGTAVAFSDEQFTTMRAKLGLPETADEAAVVAAVNSVVDESLEEHADPAGFTPPEGMALIDTAVLDELRAGASDGREARQQQREQARDNAIQAAISSGRVPKARREHYQLAWDADPEGTRQILDALEPGLVPLSELGHDNPVDETKSEEDAVYASVFGSDEKGA